MFSKKLFGKKGKRKATEYKVESENGGDVVKSAYSSAFSIFSSKGFRTT